MGLCNRDAGDVTLWQEPQNPANNMTAAQYIGMVEYYGPTVRQYYELVYDSNTHSGPAAQQAYYPGDANVNKVAVDFYASEYVSGFGLSTMAAIADKCQPAEEARHLGDGRHPHQYRSPQAQVMSYFSYVQSVMAGRIQAGKSNGEMAWA